MEFVDVNASSTTPDILDTSLRKVRISRGVFGFSGFINMKQDFDTDLQTYEVQVYYSSNGISYALSPFRIPPTPMTKVMNKEYKLYAKDALDKCCTNAPQFDRFVSPMTARNMICENCQLFTTNFPSVLRSGYYKLVVRIYERPNVTIIMLGKIDWS